MCLTLSAVASLSVHAEQGRDGTQQKVFVSQLTDSSFALHWTETRVRAPGQSAELSFSGIRYQLYMIDTAAVVLAPGLVFSTLCGLEYARSAHPSLVREFLLPSPAERGGFTVTGLHKDTSYLAFVVSVCDGACLRQFSKVHPSSGPSCAGSHTCIDLSSVYAPVQVKTLSQNTHKTSGDSSDRASIFVMVFASVGVLFALGVCFQYSKSKYMRGMDTSAFDDGAFEMSAWSKKGAERRRRALRTNDAGDAEDEHEDSYGDDIIVAAEVGTNRSGSSRGRGTYEAPSVYSVSGVARGFLSKLTPVAVGGGRSMLHTSSSQSPTTASYMHLNIDDDEIAVTL
jgi:hypothetical protein